MNAPQIVMQGDTARTRKTDVLSSHVAADKSATTRGQVHEAVVDLITMLGPLTGQELNNFYRMHRGLHGWPVVAFESPRKRAAELVGTRLVVVNENTRTTRGIPAVYGIRVTEVNA